jgi:D-alanyl-D-alanine carboxypeptidase/D-alanyl-D-alanine-endopeptidase (penicillin-binding protein 4)
MLALLLSAPVGAQPLGARLDDLMARYKKEDIGVRVIELESGADVYSHQAQKLLIPASVMKAVTAAVALHELGPEYYFKTEVWVEGLKGERTSRLSLVGGGDPSLTIESLWLLLRGIRKHGIRQVDELVFDTSRFEGSRDRLGQRAYESAASALAFNFNSIGFEVCPSEKGKAANIRTDPIEAGAVLTGTVLTSARKDAAFSIDESGQGFALAGSIYSGQDCVTVYRSVPSPVQYLERVLQALATQLDIQIGRIVEGQPSVRSELLFVHGSKPLRAVIQDMNHYSNNFIAEQIVFALGETEEGKLKRAQGLAKISSYLRGFGVPGEFVVADGSGLDRGNRLSAELLASVVREAARNEKYGIEFKNSFSVSRRNGTLRERRLERGAFVRGKTGTLTGVSSLTGLVLDRSGREYVFVVMYNGSIAKNRIVDLENAVVEEIFSYRP